MRSKSRAQPATTSCSTVAELRAMRHVAGRWNCCSGAARTRNTRRHRLVAGDG
jgi:hypothetical protein